MNSCIFERCAALGDLFEAGLQGSFATQMARPVVLVAQRQHRRKPDGSTKRRGCRLQPTSRTHSSPSCSWYEAENLALEL